MNLTQHRSKKLFGAASAWFLALSLALPVLALEPPAPGELERYRLDGTLEQRQAFARSLGNHKAAPGLIASARQKLQNIAEGRPEAAYAPPAGWRGMPTTGAVNVLALCIEFKDYPHSTPIEDVESNLFGDGVNAPPYESLRNFYLRSSYDQLEITGSVLGWYQPSYPRKNVPQSTSGREGLIKEALSHYDSQGFDFSPFDNDGDGAVDYLIVIWTGPDTGWANFWWGYQTGFYDGSYKLDGKYLSTYSWQWEANPYPGNYSARVVIHETGHALGLPDFYDYDDGIGPSGGVGGLDQMDANWGDHNCWSKFMLDWLTPELLTSGSAGLSLAASGTTQDCLLIMPDVAEGNCFDEFYMVQHRKPRTGNDSSSYPAQGLVIWHVDARTDPEGYDFLWDNSYSSHKLLRLMEADGLEEIERYNEWADAGDFYTGRVDFGPDSFPSSARYDGTHSGVVVRDISVTTDAVGFTAEIVDVSGYPAVTSMAKKGNPFRILVSGSGFQPGLKVSINGQEWPGTSVAGSTDVTISGGKSLKKAAPKGTMNTYEFRNPDGKKATVVWRWP